jgi:hypothetical protein
MASEISENWRRAELSESELIGVQWCPADFSPVKSELGFLSVLLPPPSIQFLNESSYGQTGQYLHIVDFCDGHMSFGGGLWGIYDAHIYIHMYYPPLQKLTLAEHSDQTRFGQIIGRLKVAT